MSAQKILITCLGLLALIGLSGCNDIKSPVFQPQLLEFKVCEQTADACPTDGANCTARTANDPTLVAQNLEVQFCALGLYEVLEGSDDDFSVDSAWRDVTSRARWSSGNASFVEVDQTGLATALAQSTSVPVSATLQEFEAASFVRVTAPALQEVDITPNGPLEVLVGGQIQFQCQGSFSASCDGGTSNTCDITDSASFSSSNAGQFSVSSAGLGEAITATPNGQPVEVSCSADDTSQQPPVSRVSDPTAQVTVCGLDSINSVEIVPDSLSIAVGQTQPLQLLANYTSCLTNQPAQADVTGSATWNVDDITIVEVDSDGVLEALNGGETQVTGSFAGLTSEPLTVTVSFAEVQRIDIVGPLVAVAGLQTELAYQATAILQDVDTGEEIGQEVLLNAPDEPFAVWASDSGDLVFADATVGNAALEASAVPQDVVVSATYKGVTGSLTTQVVDLTALTNIEITPSVACVGAALGGAIPQQPLGEPEVQLTAHAIVGYADPDDGTDQFCSVNATSQSEWSNGAADLTSDVLDNLLGGILSPLTDALKDALLGGCEDGTLLTVTVGEDFTGSPITVSNDEGTKGQVSGDTGSSNLAGGACIFADLAGLRGYASALAAADLQLVCDGLLAETEPSAAACAPLIAAPEEEAGE